MREDRRKDKRAPWGFVVFTDSFLSGWGHADGGRSLYALAVANDDEATTVLRAGARRTDMKRGRLVRTLRNVKMGPRDHMAIVDRHEAARWYQANGFAEVTP
jgi:hypothetical protein